MGKRKRVNKWSVVAYNSILTDDWEFPNLIKAIWFALGFLMRGNSVEITPIENRERKRKNKR